MKFEVISAEEFRTFARAHANKSFFQTPEIALLRQKKGWQPHFLAVKSGSKICAASMVVGRTTFLGKKTFYAPGGPLVDYQDEKLLSFFVQELKKYLKSAGGYVFHIDPYYELIERDRNGEVVPSGFNHSTAARNLEKLGFRPLKISEQPKYLFVMDIGGRTKDQLLADFKRNTRNHIKKAEKMGVTIRELARDELDLFKHITETTSKRRHFSDKPLDYYQTMYDLFAPLSEVKFLLASVLIDGKDTALSAAMFMLYGDEIIYLFSGSDEKYMKDYNAQYLIQWYMIQYAAEHGFLRYNFYGINGLPDPSSPDYGIYDFKKGFGGRVVELLGSYELPLNPLYYYLHHALAKIKRSV